MKKLLYFFTAVIIIGTAACDSNKIADIESQAHDIDHVELDTATSVADPFRILVGTETGVFRGVTFNSTADQVKVLEETLELREESEGFLDFIVNYNFPESAEVMYFFGKDAKVERIEVAVYPENKESQNEMYKKLIEYYNSRYGEFDVNDKGQVSWSDSLGNTFVQLEKMNGQKVHDINILFRKKGLN